MMSDRTLIAVVFALALTAPADGAIAERVLVDENPRVAWLERYQRARQGSEATDRFTATYRVGADGALDLTHISGDVRVTAHRGSDIRIEAIKRVRHRDSAEARRLLAALRIEVTQVGNRVEVRTVYPRIGNRNWNGSVDYTISVPQSAAVAVKTVSGDVSVAEVRGEVRAETVSGDVDVVSTPNLAVAKTVSGDVRARDISASTLTLGSVSGTVIANALKVRTLDANSVSGDLRLTNLQAERLTAKTVSGDIEFDGNFQRGGRYEFNAHSGDIRVTLPADMPGFELDASTFSGSVRSDFVIALRSFGRQERGRRSSSRAIRGTYGDASAILSARSFSGTVVITRR